jgi:hypothetical protein
MSSCISCFLFVIYGGFFFVCFWDRVSAAQANLEPPSCLYLQVLELETCVIFIYDRLIGIEMPIVE